MPIYWPDFDRAALEGAIAEYQPRERRFGGLVARTGPEYGAGDPARPTARPAVRKLAAAIWLFVSRLRW